MLRFHRAAAHEAADKRRAPSALSNGCAARRTSAACAGLTTQATQISAPCSRVPSASPSPPGGQPPSPSPTRPGPPCLTPSPASSAPRSATSPSSSPTTWVSRARRWHGRQQCRQYHDPSSVTMLRWPTSHANTTSTPTDSVSWSLFDGRPASLANVTSTACDRVGILGARGRAGGVGS